MSVLMPQLLLLKKSWDTSAQPLESAVSGVKNTHCLSTFFMLHRGTKKKATDISQLAFSRDFWEEGSSSNPYSRLQHKHLGQKLGGHKNHRIL